MRLSHSFVLPPARKQTSGRTTIQGASQVNERTSILQSKTRQAVRFELAESTQKSLDRWSADPKVFGTNISSLAASESRCTLRHASILS